MARRIIRSLPSKLALQSLRDQGEKFPDETPMVIVTGGVPGICVRQEPLRLVIQEPDVVVHEFGLKHGHVEIVEELRLRI